MEETATRPKVSTTYERKIKRASKEVVRTLRNLERTQPNMEDDDRYRLAVDTVAALKDF